MKFRKKPVVIDAIQFVYSVDGITLVKEFCGKNVDSFAKYRHLGAIGECIISTLEDGIVLKAQHVAQEGDWIIKGVKGEFYPCKPDIFELTYEEVK